MLGGNRKRDKTWPPGPTSGRAPRPGPQPGPDRAVSSAQAAQAAQKESIGLRRQRRDESTANRAILAAHPASGAGRGLAKAQHVEIWR